MGYTTEAELVALFGFDRIRVLSNMDAPNATTINSDRVAASIQQVSEEIDGYASIFFDTPIDPPPLVLTSRCNALVFLQLDRNRPSEESIRRGSEAIKWLEQLAAGKVSLGDSVPRKTSSAITAEPTYAGAIARVHQSRSPVFTGGRINGFR